MRCSGLGQREEVKEKKRRKLDVVYRKKLDGARCDMDPASSESSDVLLCSQGMMGMEGALFSGTLQGQQRTRLAGGNCARGGWALGKAKHWGMGHCGSFGEASRAFCGTGSGSREQTQVNNGKGWGDVDRSIDAIQPSLAVQSTVTRLLERRCSCTLVNKDQPTPCSRSTQCSSNH